MQLNRCPVCHARIGIDALVQDEAGRELMSLLCRLNTDSGSAVVGYLGLFRSGSRDLSNDRALKLAKDALSLASLEMVALAMRQTLDSLQGKTGKPLTNHNYLKKVLEDVLLNGVAPAEKSSQLMPKGVPVKTSKTAQALQALEDFGNE